MSNGALKEQIRGKEVTHYACNDCCGFSHYGYTGFRPNGAFKKGFCDKDCMEFVKHNAKFKKFQKYVGWEKDRTKDLLTSQEKQAEKKE